MKRDLRVFCFKISLKLDSKIESRLKSKSLERTKTVKSIEAHFRWNFTRSIELDAQTGSKRLNREVRRLVGYKQDSEFAKLEFFYFEKLFEV